MYWPKEKNIQNNGQKIKNIQYTGQKKRTYNIMAKR